MKIDKGYKVHEKYMDISIHKNKETRKKNIDIDKDKSTDIHISKSAKELVRQIDKSKDVNYSAKVEKIRQAILEGKYKVSSEDIADKILQTIELQKGSDR